MSNTGTDPYEFDDEDTEPRKKVVSKRKKSRIVSRNSNRSTDPYEFDERDESKNDESKKRKKTRKKTSKIVPRTKKTVVSAFIDTPKKSVRTIGLDGNTPVQERLFEPSPKKAYPWGHGLKRRASTKKKKGRKSKKGKKSKKDRLIRSFSILMLLIIMN